jgi:transcription elongation factor Elf1
MSKRISAKLAPQSTKPSEKQILEIGEESNPPEQKEESVLTELDTEIECPRCNDIMELSSTFDTLAYSCENCNFILKCV